MRDIVAALKNEIRYIELPEDQKRALLYALTFNVLSTIDGAALKEPDGTVVETRLHFYPLAQHESEIHDPIGHDGGTYMHECMPTEEDTLFDPNSD